MIEFSWIYQSINEHLKLFTVFLAKRKKLQKFQFFYHKKIPKNQKFTRNSSQFFKKLLE